MAAPLQAGAARRTINPRLGTMKIGGRLFGDPIQAIESDLTATALVLEAGDERLAIVAHDLCTVSSLITDEIREAVAADLGIPRGHVLVNESHNHSAPAPPGYYSDDYGAEFRDEYDAFFRRRIREAVAEATAALRPARIGVGWGESTIGVYRREQRGDRLVLGEVPDHPIDPSLGVIRIDDLEGRPIAIAFRYSAHPVTVGGRSAVASSDFPGPARAVLERHLGGFALFLQGCGGNINPRVGIGYEIDCTDTKNRVGLELGGEALRVAAGIRTPNGAGDDGCSVLRGLETSVQLEYGDLPGLEEARRLRDEYEQDYDDKHARNAPEWEVRVAVNRARWARDLLASVEDGGATFDLRLAALGIDDIAIVGMNVETFFETGLAIRDASPATHTFVLGYTNGLSAYLPRKEDFPPGGWRLDGDYAVPDMLPQFFPFQLVQLRPDAEERARQSAIELVRRITWQRASRSPPGSSSAARRSASGA